MINRRNSPGGGRGERVAIFIDGSNLYHSLQENCGRFDVDFAALGQRLTDGRELLRIYYYNVLRDSDRDPQAYQDQQKFLTALHNTPYIETRLGSSKMRRPDHRGEGHRHHGRDRTCSSSRGTICTTSPYS